MPSGPPPFSAFERAIAWRYLRAKRAEGGVSTMTWISLIGIMLAVFALVATLAVRAGLRAETLQAILGANAHIELYYTEVETETGGRDASITDFGALTERIRAVPGVTHAAAIVEGRLIANLGQENVPLEVHGMQLEDLKGFDSVQSPETATGDLANLEGETIALGAGLARELGAFVGDRVRLISPNGARTPFGVSPRVSSFEVVYVFRSGHRFIDSTRAYLPLETAQIFLNKEDAADRIEILLDSPEDVDAYTGKVLEAADTARAYHWTWRNRSGGFLRALELQDNAIFILLAILVLIATMNIVSGLIMLVKNKGRDIGILRTMGLSQGMILRVFFLVGSFIGVIGTILGVGLGVLFAINIDHVYALMDLLTGGSRSRLIDQGFFFPPAIVRPVDVALSVALAMGLSFVVTWFPARRAARMHPVEALRYG